MAEGSEAGERTGTPRGAAGPRPAAAREARGERRKRETRRRLMQAAFELMAERGRAAVAISEITEAADVGFGSFYNHFESKEELHDTVVDEVLVRFGKELSHIADVLDDPAEILAGSMRYVTERARREPRWGRFLVRSAFSLRNLSAGLGRFLLQDIDRGLASGRFRSDDRLMTLLTVGGMAAAGINAQLELTRHPEAAPMLRENFELDADGLATRLASTALQIVGLPADEALEIASRPLPPMDLDLGDGPGAPGASR